MFQNPFGRGWRGVTITIKEEPNWCIIKKGSVQNEGPHFNFLPSIKWRNPYNRLVSNCAGTKEQSRGSGE